MKETKRSGSVMYMKLTAYDGTDTKGTQLQKIWQCEILILIVDGDKQQATMVLRPRILEQVKFLFCGHILLFVVFFANGMDFKMTWIRYI